MSKALDAAEFHARMDAGEIALSAENVERYAKGWAASPRAGLFDEIKSISMLHQESLALLYLFARRCGGDVLEIGPYIGGSTVVMAQGLKDAGAGKLVTVEVGGAYDHPQLPSTDIIADLDANLRRYGVRDLVEIVEGWSFRTATRKKIASILARNTVGMLSIDANGMPGADLWMYEKHLKDECLMIVDDVITDEADNAKQLPVAQFIERSTSRGPLNEFAVVQWGTWAGIYQRPSPLLRFYYAARDLDGMQPLIGKYRFPWHPITRFLRQRKERSA